MVLPQWHMPMRRDDESVPSRSAIHSVSILDHVAPEFGFDGPVQLAVHSVSILDHVDPEFGRVTEFLCERNAVPELAPFAMGEWRDVEDDNENDEERQGACEADDAADHLGTCVEMRERDVRHEREADEEAEDTTEDVREVVDERKAPDANEDDEYEDESADSATGLAEDVPVVKDFDQEARQNCTLTAGWSSLKMSTNRSR